jgi:hypothetical protein
MSTSNSDDLLCRVERLERANRGWKSIAVVACVAVVVLSVACGAAYSQREPQAQPAGAAGSAGAQAPAIEAGVAPAVYTNYCRVSGTAEEVILDFCVALIGTGEVPPPPIERTNRIAMNFYTLKRLIPALQTTLDRHEQAYGPVEIDAQKRMRPGIVQ